MPPLVNAPAASLENPELDALLLEEGPDSALKMRERPFPWKRALCGYGEAVWKAARDGRLGW
ncbi:MAG: hypothetical protein HYR73_09455 [Candidatus Eisenbacteria bacterium]|nr:hypothetical protein [Candidatus Eisenbacteria bacterium]